jgi:antitoxin component HigA of HigAB toxin-antitoxin module
METVRLEEIVKSFGCARNLSRLAGVAPSTLSRVLAGKRHLGMKLAKKLARTAKVKPVIVGNAILFMK